MGWVRYCGQGELLVIESWNVEKNENRGTNRHGRRFDEEFKRDAVRMLNSGERSAQQLSQELGVSVWSLKRWNKGLFAQPLEKVKVYPTSTTRCCHPLPAKRSVDGGRSSLPASQTSRGNFRGARCITASGQKASHRNIFVKLIPMNAANR